MTFKNEYIPPLEQETSEFLKKAREILHTGYSKHDKWTVDREREMGLVRQGRGHSLDSANEDYWGFIDYKGSYSFTTWTLSQSEISSEEIAITRQIGFKSREGLSKPDTETITCIKEALREHKDYGVVSDYQRCQLTLIDGNGKEI